MPEVQPITVSALTYKIKSSLEGSFPSLLVQGELSNCKLHTSGHFYFVLKDEHAQIAGVMWRSRVAGLAFKPEDGMKVVVSGRLTVYEVRGNYQIDAGSIRPLGVGELQAAFEQLKRKLEAEGLFDAGRKRPLPLFPARIGIVTSETGAALQDMLRVLKKRFPAVEVVLRPCLVQGPGAAADIARGIADLNVLGGVHVLIIGRGGGSLEDLWPFNEEIVARAIASSGIPVVSAVGHEVDYTIADFVADARAATPTAAAAMVVQDRAVILDNLRDSCYTMKEKLFALLDGHRQVVRSLLRSYSLNRPLDLLRQYSQRCDDQQRALAVSGTHFFALRTARVTALAQRLEALGPDQVLRRGYAIVRKGGVAVQSRKSLRSRDAIEISFRDGSVRSTVE